MTELLPSPIESQIRKRQDADKPLFAVHDGEASHLASLKLSLGLRERVIGTTAHNIGRHALRDSQLREILTCPVGVKADVAIGDDADDAPLLIDHRNRPAVLPAHDLQSDGKPRPSRS